MSRLLAAVAAAILYIFTVCHVAEADTVKLTSGQVHKGVITAEESDRVQMKLEGSGVRIWFARDQIESLKKKSQDDPEEESTDDPTDDPENAEPEDDVARARKLLDKIREENDPTVYKSKERKPADDAEDEAPDPGPSHVQATGASTSEIEQLVEKIRNGGVRDRLAACSRLGEVGGIDEVPHLIHALDDKESPLIRKAANDALEKITEQDMKYDPYANRSVRLEAIDRWENWYKEQKEEKAQDKLRSLW